MELYHWPEHCQTVFGVQVQGRVRIKRMNSLPYMSGKTSLKRPTLLNLVLISSQLCRLVTWSSCVCTLEIKKPTSDFGAANQQLIYGVRWTPEQKETRQSDRTIALSNSCLTKPSRHSPTKEQPPFILGPTVQRSISSWKCSPDQADNVVCLT